MKNPDVFKVLRNQLATEFHRELVFEFSDQIDEAETIDVPPPATGVFPAIWLLTVNPSFFPRTPERPAGRLPLSTLFDLLDSVSELGVVGSPAESQLSRIHGGPVEACTQIFGSTDLGDVLPGPRCQKPVVPIRHRGCSLSSSASARLPSAWIAFSRSELAATCGARNRSRMPAVAAASRYKL